MPENMMNDPSVYEIEPLEARPSGGGSDFNILRWLHYLLRGRYHWAVLLALILGSAAGYYLYQRVVPVYESQGIIRIRSYTPRLLYGNDASGKMPNFDTFMNDQVRTLNSERVAAMAMESEAWRALDRPFTPEAQEEFRRNLHAWRSDEIIVVRFRNPDPVVAEIATKAAVEAFQRLFQQGDPTQDRARMQILDESRISLSNQLNAIKDQVATFGDAFGPDGVRFRYQQAVTRLRDLEEDIRKTELEIVVVEARLAQDPPMPSMEELRESQPRLAALFEELDNRKLRMATLKREFADDHSAVLALQERIDHVEGQIKDALETIDLGRYRQAWQEQWSDQQAKLKTKMADLQSRVAEGERTLQQVSEEKNRLGRLELESKEVGDKLAQVRTRIEQLNFENRMGDRLQVYEYGRSGKTPINAKEPTKQATMGAFAGGSVGVAIIMLIGLINPTLRQSDDLTASHGAPKVLGMLPHLPDHLNNPEEAYFAGQCVHQIRMFLQLEGGPDEANSFVVTGPEPGTGKTSLTMALGFSYAAAGAKTLLVDFDLIGGGLTSRLGIGRYQRFGRLLQEEGLVSAEVIDEVAEDLELEGRLGEKLVARGLIQQADVERVLELQQRCRVGLLDVLAGKPLDMCVTDLPTENLSLLSVGNATADHISRVGRSAVKRFLKEVRGQYDVVLVDTGPIPGSVEASLIAAEADRVVLAVSRGDQMRRVNECQRFLRAIGARVAGVVFNRAERRDMARSRNVLTSSTRSQSFSSRSRSRQDQHRQLGPVVIASGGATRTRPGYTDAE
jgi:Mrp family chromosome partitioning ATPase/uncharacterized protein involved in exopolysaccharide biosynthesis